jgi:hypothetical protein
MKEDKHLNLLFEGDEHRTRVSIELTEEASVQEATDSTLKKPVTSPRKEEVSLLKTQVSAKNRFRSIKSKVPKTILALAEGALIGASIVIPQAKKPNDVGIDKPEVKLKKPPSTLEVITGQSVKSKSLARRVKFTSNGDPNVGAG